MSLKHVQYILQQYTDNRIHYVDKTSLQQKKPETRNKVPRAKVVKVIHVHLCATIHHSVLCFTKCNFCYHQHILNMDFFI